MSKTLKELRDEIKTNVGKTIDTCYGPSVVEGMLENETIVHLRGFDGEDYLIEIEQWEELF